jgi:hypothetical protein
MCRGLKGPAVLFFSLRILGEGGSTSGMFIHRLEFRFPTLSGLLALEPLERVYCVKQ